MRRSALHPGPEYRAGESNTGTFATAIPFTIPHTGPETRDLDGDGLTAAQGDCDDHDANVNTNSVEICDRRDNDCDGVDGNDDLGFSDNDEDGFFAPGADCDDTEASVNPEAEEICDGLDNNCDFVVDEDCVEQVSMIAGGCMANQSNGDSNGTWILMTVLFALGWWRRQRSLGGREKV